MTTAYLQNVDWEAPASLEARAASLLPGLFLARIDGKSPVEYITEEREKEKVRGNKYVMDFVEWKWGETKKERNNFCFS